MDKSPEQLPPRELKINISGSSEASLDHPHVNEDSIAFDQQGKWAVLLDGVGGLEAGNRASRAAKEEIVKWISRIRDNTDMGEVEKAMVGAFIKASERVKKKIPRGGTTAVAVRVVGRDKKVAVIASVGDSRVYLARRGSLEQITEDDSPIPLRLREKLDNVSEKSELARDELVYFGIRNYITQDLGQQKPLNVHTYTIELLEEDHLVLTSDGVHDNLTASEIQDVVVAGGEVVDNLVEASSNRATQESSHFRAKMDDISAIVMEVKR